MYIPQRPSLLPLTPRDFVFTALSFYSRRRTAGSKSDSTEGDVQRRLEDIMLTGKRLGVGDDLWDRNWTELSGGEGQRIMLAIGASLGTAEVLLFDGTHVPDYFASLNHPFISRSPCLFYVVFASSRTDIRVGSPIYSRSRTCSSAGTSQTRLKTQGHSMDHSFGRTSPSSRV